MRYFCLKKQIKKYPCVQIVVLPPLWLYTHSFVFPSGRADGPAAGVKPGLLLEAVGQAGLANYVLGIGVLGGMLWLGASLLLPLCS